MPHNRTNDDNVPRPGHAAILGRPLMHMEMAYAYANMQHGAKPERVNERASNSAFTNEVAPNTGAGVF